MSNRVIQLTLPNKVILPPSYHTTGLPSPYLSPTFPCWTNIDTSKVMTHCTKFISLNVYIMVFFLYGVVFSLLSLMFYFGKIFDLFPCF